MRRATLTLVLVLVASACSVRGSVGERPQAPSSTVAVVPATPATTSSTTTTTTIVDSAAGTSSTTTTTSLPPLQQLALQPVADVDSPVWVGSPPGADDRLFVVEQPGRVQLLENGVVVGPYLTITDRVAFGNERGLLGLAFHPEFDRNGRLFVNYTEAGSGATVVSEFRADPAAATADRDSERVLLRVPQPASNHNGGMIAFGPDGMLYVGMGDGGGRNDQFGQAQRADTLLGAMLRIDVDGGEPYAVPADNPFATGEGGAQEVWAVGLRNPWRFSFDGELLYVADVGQSSWEEIDVTSLEPGLNFGWSIREGSECFRQAGCQSDGLVAPVLQYDHGEGCSVTGGVVYRGRAIPELVGHYLYADYCGGWVRSFRLEDGAATEGQELFGQVGAVTSFGHDGDGEVYLTLHSGPVVKLVAER